MRALSKYFSVDNLVYHLLEKSQEKKDALTFSQFHLWKKEALLKIFLEGGGYLEKDPAGVPMMSPSRLCHVMIFLFVICDYLNVGP